MKLMPRALDRYVFFEWAKIFGTTALGFPLLVIVIDLTDNLEKYLSRHLSREAIALSYLYWLPESMFLILPAAVLFATVFSIGSFTRYSEVTAAKASGISFFRLIAPIMVGAALAAVFGFALGELAPITTAKRNDILEEDKSARGTERFNFVYSAENGRVYKASSLSVPQSQMGNFQIELKGNGPDYPTTAFVSWIIIRKMIVTPRLTPTPYAAPPRCVLVASGAPNSAMIRHVTGIAILSACSTLSSLTSPPDRCSALMNRPRSRYPISCGERGVASRSAGCSFIPLSRSESKLTAKSGPTSLMTCAEPACSIHPCGAAYVAFAALITSVG